MGREAKKEKKKTQKRKSSPVRTVSRQEQSPACREKTSTSSSHLEIGHPTKVLIFELETLALEQGRKRVFDSAKQVMAGAGLSLAPMLFCKMGIESTPSSFFSGALLSLKLRMPSHPRVKTAFDVSCRKALCERPMLRSGFAEIIAKVRARGMHSVAISFLGAETAGELMKATGLENMGVQLTTGKAWIVHPYSENLVNRVVDRLRVLPATCVTLVSSGAAADAALCAGTRVVAVPDSFTSFQAFSGVDEVLDTWNAETVESALSLDGEGR